MLDEMLIRHCAPTLAGLKTANMFNQYYANESDMKDEIRELNHRLADKGIMAIPLRYNGHTALIYICRLEKLRNDLRDNKAAGILKGQGYTDCRPGCCIARLSKRLESGEFPHEVGLFLGYPPEDVEGFIEKRACKFCGYWKVYSNVESARRTFAKYKKCIDVYLSQWQMGKSVERLAVSA